MQPTARPSYKPFTPDPKSLCLCGSGARYQNCCKGRLPDTNNDKKWRKAAKEKRWTEMVRHLRADVTQYTIWHLSHTAPAVAKRPELRHAYLMNIDIEALSDYVESLMWGYARKGWLDRLPATLDRLKTNIDDPRWRAKIAYQRGICALWQGDRDEAARQIEPLQPITPETADVDLLQIHVDLHGTKMGMTERIAFFDRIRALSESRSDKLQYGGARSFEILLAEDESGARAAFDEVIALGREMEEEEPLGATSEIWFCRALEGRAILGQGAALFKEIDERLSRLLIDPDRWSRVGRANIWRTLGDARRYAGGYGDALQAYRESNNLIAAPELRTFEAECELRLSNPDEAFRLIRSVSVNKLNAPERADHAFTYFYIALARGDRRSLIDARDLLKTAITPQAYFQTRRLQHIITIGDALEALAKKEDLPQLGPILSTVKKVSRYVQLQPNWNGLGLNGNVIINDFVAYAQNRLKREAEETPTYPEEKIEIQNDD